MKAIVLSSVLLFIALSVYAQDEQGINEQEIKKLSNDWMAAAMKRDEQTLNKIMSPEFKLAGTDLERPALSRAIWMKNTMENMKIDSTNYIKMHIDVVDNVAIVRSKFYWSFSFANMPARKATVDMIDTWIKKGKSWQVVSRIVVDQ